MAPLFILRLLSRLYLYTVRFRNFLYETNLLSIRKLPCKVISIGNLCVGGTGKTPMTIYISELLRNQGYKVCVITRGYRGKAEKKGGIAGDGQAIFMSPDIAGDEPYMMARTLKHIPVIVGRNRFQSGMTAIHQFGAEVIVLDDAFQHRKLFRDVDIVLLDGKAPLGIGKLLPLGRLREPVEALSRSHAVVFTRSEPKDSGKGDDPSIQIRNILKKQPTFHSMHLPHIHAMIQAGEMKAGLPEVQSTLALDSLEGKRVVAFSGLAENNHFKNTLLEHGIDIVDYYGFKDHHVYSKEDLQTLIGNASRSRVEYLVTTEKDYVKLPDDMAWHVALVVVGVKLSMGSEEKDFELFLMNQLSR
ncbi:MAG: tetraacyldisaccharide 4'-kinase [Proteobacteria bacterium]|nr:tetraacyldisaccharide 4'-kinase [Pseudomonadota bacterium]MBU4470662.1 tetraacyldisaccharide 4'-kinase [Pseudomonadota bacterium]MCG2751243.1 tetraacyldisaccharide 4'-kinase [Desulfobacteraceae bacterium]